ncbi:DNA repair protein RecO [candidate division KSB3 bacterium]|uniref:DNA repair protein RecO n=1 Tax=candidate division KSB3 bacterium TaxID=2044937 RepID=A0A2G6KIS2_9BACT|nr:MAG: DNA repair protein RecO [candidate division KSB3 bacterium]
MAFKRTEAIVIKTLDLKEADKIITFFSRDYGKVSGIARGIRKIQTKYSGKLELFTRVNVIFFHKTKHLQSGENHPLLKITQADVVEVFPKLHADFNRIIAASYIAELLQRTLEEFDDSHRPVYVLVCNALRLLATVDDIRAILPAFEIKLLAHLGYAPVLGSCTGCGKPKTTSGHHVTLSEQSYRTLPGFHFATGGILCPRCKRLKKGAVDINHQAIEILQHLLNTDISLLNNFSLSPLMYQEIRGILTSYIQYHLGISLKADSFVKKLRSANIRNREER